MNFGEAIEMAKNGHLITRKGWNGKGMFVFMRPGDELPLDMVVQKVKSLPIAVKDYFHNKCNDEDGNAIPLEKGKPVKFTPYLCMKNAQGEIINGWVASQSDILGEDWHSFEY